MPRNKTAAELKDEYICSMGSYLGAVYYSTLWQDVALLHVKWDEYVQLYGTKSRTSRSAELYRSVLFQSGSRCSLV